MLQALAFVLAAVAVISLIEVIAEFHPDPSHPIAAPN